MGKRKGLLVLGVVLVAVGVPMLVLPGPGLLSIVAGIACLVAARRSGKAA